MAALAFVDMRMATYFISLIAFDFGLCILLRCEVKF